VTIAAHPHLTITDDGPVRTITVNRPEARNAQVPSLWSALATLARELPDDTRVVVLRGAGEAFSAGLDRGMLSPAGIPGEPAILPLGASGDAAAIADLIAEFQEGFSAWRSCRSVVIAQVHGYAIGAGFQLALAADLRVVADDVRFAMKEASLGLIPDLGGTSPLVHLVGYARALELCATGRFVGADEAVALGLATIAVPRADLDNATRDLAYALLAVPPKALAELKPLLANAIHAPFEAQLRAEREAQARRFVSLARGTG